MRGSSQHALPSPAVALLALAALAGCGGRGGDPDDAGDATDLAEEADAADATDPGTDLPIDSAIDSLVDTQSDAPVDNSTDTPADTPTDTPVDPGEEDTRPPLGPCGGYCMGESRSCPDGALCEFGILDITFACTDDNCGLCAWIPETCPPDDDPACGCNGVVYANPCERRRALAQPDPAWMNCTIPDE